MLSSTFLERKKLRVFDRLLFEVGRDEIFVSIVCSANWASSEKVDALGISTTSPILERLLDISIHFDVREESLLILKKATSLNMP